MLRIFCVLVCALSVTGCASTSLGIGGTPDYTVTGFSTPSTGSLASIPVSLGNETNDRIFISGIGGAAYVTGTTDEGARAFAGIIPGTDAGATVTSGTIVYDTNYEIISIEDIFVSGGFLTGQQDKRTGSMTLTADFNANTLRGSDSVLQVNGTILNSDINGFVRYSGINGPLDGVIGADAAVGAFHGNNDRIVFSGGFIGTN